MITFTKSGARQPLAMSIRATIGYGMNININEGRPGATLQAVAPDGRVYAARITSDEIDRLVAMRDAYERETHHRGYPVKG